MHLSPGSCHHSGMSTETRESGGFTFRIRSDGILEIRARPGSNHGTQEAKASARILRELGSSGPRPVLLVIDGIRELTREARMIYRDPATTEYVLAAALIARSPLARLFASFALGVNRPEVPVRIFDDEDTATKWLAGFL